MAGSPRARAQDAPAPPPPGRPLAAAAVALAAALPALALYVATLHPGLPAGDSGELVAVAATGGVAHPPGYPLWTMLAGLWLRAWPAGGVAWRLNLFSAGPVAPSSRPTGRISRRAPSHPSSHIPSVWPCTVC